ncbi:cysteinyl leukotriene receptor 2-like [Hemibagrus wyckioides]|uniref:cysteinyl leukotriene receptor 2-like n=1 Tax=Hemibagrus wyckioides TaxID=337641 RepID=UPI00266CF716|nr:cysteinyl leukotriene receptor 2-like [Hemibagrus wyckioides]XP_058274755.1 cysteinyl leukotriene receptor 2-like [Hemibagrus wyckioides]
MESGEANSSVLKGPSCNLSEEYKFKTYTVVFSLIFIFGLISNVGALYVFCKLSVKNRLSTIFLIHLAVSDLIFIFTLPLRIAFYFSSLTGLKESSPRPAMSHLSLACRFSTFLFYISMYCSIFFLTALSLCRYMVLAGRVRLQNSEACRWARLLCWGIWVFVVGGNFLHIGITSGFSMEAGGCLEPAGKKSWAFLYHLNLVVLVTCFLLPLTVVLICYSLMIRHILKIRAGQRQRDVALICLVLLIFCFCFLPYHIQRTLHLHYMMFQQTATCKLLASLQKSVVVTLCFAALNSCLDPLLFLFVGHGFIAVMNKFIARVHLSCAIENTSLSDMSQTVVQLPLVIEPKTTHTGQGSPLELSPSENSDITV